MAKGSFVLEGARGKVGTLVARKGPKGGTVISQRVSPRNPQSDKQMVVRCTLGTLATAGSNLWQIVGQTFESAADEATNKRLFTRANMPYLRAEGMKGMAGNITTGAFCPKGGRYLVPNAYIISQGSLESPENLTPSYSDDDSAIVLPVLSITVSGTMTAAALWQKIFGLLPGQQATFVQIYTKQGENVAYDVAAMIGYEEGLGKNIVRYARMTAHRLVLKSGVGSSITITAETTVADIRNCLDSLVDKENTSTLIWSVNPDKGISYLLGYSDGECLFSGVDLYQDSLIIPSYSLKAAGIVISQYENNKWQYNRAVMAQYPPEYYDAAPFADERYGLNIQEAVDSYRRGQSSSSPLYTRQGGNVDDLGV